MKPIVSLRIAKTASDTKSYSLGVPVEIARLLEAADKTTFELDLTEDGVLYRPIKNVVSAVALPEWLAPPAESAADSAADNPEPPRARRA